MTITQEQIDSIAKKLGKVTNNNKNLEKNINEVLEYVELLNEVDTTGVIPTVNVVKKENKLRKDIEIKTENPEELLNCSNNKVIANQIAISNIMK